MPALYDESKLSEDLELVRGKYQDRGYFTALVLDPKTRMRDTGGGFHIPLFLPNKPAKREFGFINMVVTPDTDIDRNNKRIHLTCRSEGMWLGSG